MDGWDLLLLVVVAFVAVMALVRLMLVRRDQLIKDLQKQLDAQVRARKAAVEKPENRAA